MMTRLLHTHTPFSQSCRHPCANSEDAHATGVRACHNKHRSMCFEVWNGREDRCVDRGETRHRINPFLIPCDRSGTVYKNGDTRRKYYVNGGCPCDLVRMHSHIEISVLCCHFAHATQQQTG
jgi:hypothetical protein